MSSEGTMLLHSGIALNFATRDTCDGLTFPPASHRVLPFRIDGKKGGPMSEASR